MDTQLRYRIVVDELPAVFDDGRKLRRIAAITGAETISAAFEGTGETWAVAAYRPVEDLTGILDPNPLTAGSERTARKWVELIARLYLLADKTEEGTR